MVARKGTALLTVFTDIDLEYDSEFNDWYNQEHLPDLLKQPGVLDAGRYQAVLGGPRYLACYELESAAVVNAPQYLALVQNPTERGKRVGPSRIGRNYIRNLYTQIYPQENDLHMLGRGMAPALQIGRMSIAPEIEAKFNEYYDTVRTPANLQMPGCIAVRRYHVVTGAPKYLTVYEFEHEKVPETRAWQDRWDRDEMEAYAGGNYVHAPGSPGIYRRIFPPRPF